MTLQGNQCGVVDGETQADLDQFAKDIITATREGKRFLFRSAASILTALSQLGTQPVPPEEMAQYKPTANAGVVLMGSHVQKSTRQLKQLLQEPTVSAIEVDVIRLRDYPTKKEEILQEILAKVQEVYQTEQTPVVYTSEKN